MNNAVLFPWRQCLLERRCPQVTSPLYPIGILSKIALPVLSSSYLLTGKDIFRLEAVASACVQLSSANHFFRRWLLLHEDGRGTLFSTTRFLFAEYEAAILQRCFLRRIQQLPFSVVLAGSYPAAMYLQSRGNTLWQPNDIDIFTFDAMQFAHIVRLYHEILTVPLGLSIHADVWQNYEEEHEDSRVRVPEEEPEDSSERVRVPEEEPEDSSERVPALLDNGHGNSDEQPSVVHAVVTRKMSLSWLREKVLGWISWFGQRYISEEFESSVEDDNISDFALLRLLHGVLSHMPKHFSPHLYKVTENVRLTPCGIKKYSGGAEKESSQHHFFQSM